MPSEASFKISKTLPFVVDANRIRQLHELMRPYSESPGYSIKCSDGLNRSVDIDGLVGFDNSPGRRILKIRAFAGDYKSGTAAVELGESFGENFSVEANGSEERVDAIRRSLDELMAASRPWYWLFARVSIFTVWAILSVIYLLSLTIYGTVTASFSLGDTSSDEAQRRIGFAIIVGIAAPVVIFAADMFRRRLFPVSTFAVGQGLQRHEDLDKWRWLVIGGVVLAFVVNIAAGFFLMFFT